VHVLIRAAPLTRSHDVRAWREKSAFAPATGEGFVTPDGFLMSASALPHAHGRNLSLAAIGSAKPETHMKLLSTLTIAALLTTGSAFAASASTPTATPATTATPAAKKHGTGMHCEKEAKARKLTGDEASKFVKDCKEGKKD
jgi:hypothetical protein